MACADRLLKVAEPTKAGLRWLMMADMPFAFTAPNFAHGGAGVGYFLLEVYRVTGEERYLEAAKSAARYGPVRADTAGDGGRVCHPEGGRNPALTRSRIQALGAKGTTDLTAKGADFSRPTGTLKFPGGNG